MLRVNVGQGNQNLGGGSPSSGKLALVIQLAIAAIAILWVFGGDKLGTDLTGAITVVIVLLALVPAVYLTKSSPPAAKPEGRSLEERLKELDSLRTKGLITEREYTAKKQEILSAL